MGSRPELLKILIKTLSKWGVKEKAAGLALGNGRVFACASVCVQYVCGYVAWGIWEMSSWPLFLYWRCKLDVNQHDARCQGKVHPSRLANSSWLYALKLRRWEECEHVHACLNLNETGPLKVSAEQAGTLSSAANGVLMIQRSLMLAGAHPSTPLTQTHPPNHPHRHMKNHIQYRDNESN